MRKYPHKPDEQNQRENQELESNELVLLAPETEQAMSTRSPIFFQGNAKSTMALGAYAYAFEEPKDRVLNCFRESCRNLRIAIEFRLPLDPVDFITYLSLALIVRDGPLLERLTSFTRERYTNPNVECHEIMYLIAEIQADLVAKRLETIPSRLSKALAILDSRKLNHSEREVATSLILVMQAIVGQKQADLDKTLAMRHHDFAHRFSRPDEREDPEGLLDICGLGLLRLALDNGLRCNVQSVYTPVELLEG